MTSEEQVVALLLHEWGEGLRITTVPQAIVYREVAEDRTTSSGRKATPGSGSQRILHRNGGEAAPWPSSWRDCRGDGERHEFDTEVAWLLE